MDGLAGCPKATSPGPLTTLHATVGTARGLPSSVTAPSSVVERSGRTIDRSGPASTVGAVFEAWTTTRTSSWADSSPSVAVSLRR